MKLELVRIGNSRGIRIPKTLIEQCGFGETVEVLVEDNRLVITPERATRQGWKDAFAAADPSADDPVPFNRLPANDFDAEEWSW
jgi:antitoxin MazE